MVQDLEAQAQRQAGLTLRRSKCTRAQIKQKYQPREEAPPECQVLLAMDELPRGSACAFWGRR